MLEIFINYKNFQISLLYFFAQLCYCWSCHCHWLVSYFDSVRKLVSVRLLPMLDFLKFRKKSQLTYLFPNYLSVIFAVTGTAAVVTVTRTGAVVTVTGTADIAFAFCMCVL